MKSVFFVVKPLELLGAIEARNQFHIDDTILIIKPEKQDISTIELLIEKSGNWNTIIWMKTKSSYGFKWINLIKKLQKERYKYVFTRGFALGGLFIHNLQYQNSFILDDGTATINISKEFEEQKNLTNRFSLFKGRNSSGLKYSLFEKLYRSKDIIIEKPVKEISFFTYYDLPEVENQKVEINQFNWLQSQLTSSKKVSKDIVFVLGTNVVNGGIMKFEDYYITLQKINNFYNDKELIYIPHGRESESHLELIESNLRWSIRKNKYNVELDFMINEEIPNTIVGTITTALITLKLIYKDEVKVDFFNFNPIAIFNDKKQSIKNVVNYQKSYIDFQELEY